MRILVTTMTLIAMATIAVAQRPDMGNMRRMMGPGIAMQSADADGNQEVSADEWAKFTTSVKNQDGALDLKVLQTRILGKALDANKNGKLEKADLETVFKALDTDADGALSSEEMTPRRRGMRGERGGEDGDGERPRRRRDGEGEGEGKGGDGTGRGKGEGRGGERREGEGQGRRPRTENQSARPSMMSRFTGRAVLDAADADQSRSITAEEWKSFLGKFQVNEETGAIDAGAVTTELMKERQAPEGDEFGGMRRRMDLGSMLGLETFDADQDGKLAQADFDKMFTDLDKDADKVVTREEMSMRRGFGGRRGGRGGDDGKDV